MGALRQIRPRRLLEQDRQVIERQLAQLLPAGGGPVAGAMRYAVLGGGQRVRPVLALRTARAMRAETKVTAVAACAVELLHCASLIVDDLPCMDNSALRRGRPSAHVAFGEPTSLLAAFALVALSARAVTEADASAPSIEFQRCLLRALDSNGLIEGQAMDLVLAGEDRERRREQITDLKTVPLFLLAMRAGLLFAKGPAGHSEAALSFGREFGLAFQMVDDLHDRESADADGTLRQIEAARECLRPLGRRAEELQEVVDWLHDAANREHHRHR